jgi:SAM-dependent methyltransferase
MLGWLRNAVDYRIRQTIRLRRGPARLPRETKAGLFIVAAAAEAERLVAAYHLEQWRETAGRVDFATSLSYLQMLERALREARVTLPAQLRVLDAGCGDWFYVQTLYGLLQHFGAAKPRGIRLDGVEFDAYALYAGFRSRHDWAAAYMNGLAGARYIPGDICDYREPVNVAFMLFPFLFANDDMLRWGLPRRYLRPPVVLKHVAGLVEPGGVLILANLGEAERQEQHRLLAEAGLEVAWWGQAESLLSASDRPRFVTVVCP